MRTVQELRQWLHERPWTFFPVWVVFMSFVLLASWLFTIETEEPRQDRDRRGIGVPL